jgi:predicted amidohydrolase
MPAEWPASRLEAWRTLLRARAIENQLFMAGVNRVGESRGEIFGGASAVIDPQGRAITEGGDQEALFTAELDLEEVERTRKRIPILQDRRLDLYG